MYFFFQIILFEIKILFFCFVLIKKLLLNFDMFRFIHFFVVKNKISYT